MTSREKHLAVLRKEPIDGILWQPRIEHWYEVNARNGTLPDRYREMSLLEVFDDLNCSVRPYWVFCEAIRIEDPPEVWCEEKTEGSRTVVVKHTPLGDLTTIESRTGLANHTVKYPVVTTEDMKILEWILLGRRIWFDWEVYENGCALIGERAAPCVYISRVNLMRLVHEYMGFENGLTSLYQWPRETEHLLETINETDDALLEMISACPIEIINFGDNVHQAFCPPPLFERWVLPEYQRRNEVLHKAGKKTYPHWDGDCGQLLPYAGDCGFDGFEAITPAPQGDVTLEQMRDALGDCILIDGIPCTDFLSSTPIESLVENTKKCLRYFAPNLVLGISDEISPVGDIERVRLVSELVADC
jgi:hypothetical protein